MTISTTYDLKWQLSFAKEYQFTSYGICINTKRNKVVKKVLNCRSVGWCIKGKFYSATYLRQQLTKIETINCPF